MTKKQFISAFLSLTLLFFFCSTSYASGRGEASRAIVSMKNAQEEAQHKVKQTLGRSGQMGLVGYCVKNPKKLLRASRFFVYFSSDELPKEGLSEQKKPSSNSLELQSLTGQVNRLNIKPHPIDTESLQSEISGQNFQNESQKSEAFSQNYQALDVDVTSHVGLAEYWKQDAIDRVRKQTTEANEILDSEPQTTLDEVFLEMRKTLDEDEKAIRLINQQIRRDSRKKAFTDILPTEYFSDLIEKTRRESSSIFDKITLIYSELFERDKFKKLNFLISNHRNKFYLLVKSRRFEMVPSISSFFKETDQIGKEVFLTTPYLSEIQEKVNATAKKLEMEQDLFNKTDGKVMAYLMFKYENMKIEIEDKEPLTAKQIKETYLKYTAKGQILEEFSSEAEVYPAQMLLENAGISIPLMTQLKSTKIYLFDTERDEAIVQLQKRVNRFVLESRKLSKRGLLELNHLKITAQPRIVKFSDPDSFLLATALQFYNPGVYIPETGLETGLLQKVLENDARTALAKVCQEYKSFKNFYVE